MGIIAASRLRATGISPFIIEVDTLDVNSPTFQFTGAVGDYDVIAKQNDIVVATFNDLSGQQTITLPSSGVYVLEVIPKEVNGFNRIAFDNGGDKLKITDIKQWGGVVWSSFDSAFYGCENLTGNYTDSPNLVNVTSLRRMFRGCSVFNGQIANWDFVNITDLDGFLLRCFDFNQPFENINTSNVTNMRSMLYEANSFNQPLNNLDTSSVENFQFLFFNNTSFSQPINDWDVSSVTIMDRMFFGSSFNQPLNNWDVSNVTDMLSMFRNAPSFNQDLSGWCVSQIGSRPTTFDDGASSWVLPNSRPNWGAAC
jgi:surface protein